MAAFGDYKSTFWQLFSKNNSLTIHHCNPLKLATEAFNMKIGMAPVIMNVFDILIILLETRHNSDQKILKQPSQILKQIPVSHQQYGTFCQMNAKWQAP